MSNKRRIDLVRANRLINVGPVILITSKLDDNRNIFTAAWNMAVSHKPPIMAIASQKSNFSSELIIKSKFFIINIPHKDLKEKIIYCGKTSGRDVDKFDKCSFTPVKSNTNNVPIIRECIGHIECSLLNTFEVGDHYLFVGEVVSAYADEDKFDFENNVWILEKANLIQHVGGSYFSTILLLQ